MGSQFFFGPWPPDARTRVGERGEHGNLSLSLVTHSAKFCSYLSCHVDVFWVPNNWGAGTSVPIQLPGHVRPLKPLLPALLCEFG